MALGGHFLDEVVPKQMGGDVLRLYGKFVDSDIMLKVAVVSSVAVPENMIETFFNGMDDEGGHVFCRYFSPYIVLGSLGNARVGGGDVPGGDILGFVDSKTMIVEAMKNSPCLFPCRGCGPIVTP